MPGFFFLLNAQVIYTPWPHAAYSMCQVTSVNIAVIHINEADSKPV